MVFVVTEDVSREYLTLLQLSWGYPNTSAYGLIHYPTKFSRCIIFTVFAKILKIKSVNLFQ